MRGLGVLYRASFPELRTARGNRHRHLARQRARRANAGIRDALLLVVGIHNAWDLVIWLSQQRRK